MRHQGVVEYPTLQHNSLDLVENVRPQQPTEPFGLFRLAGGVSTLGIHQSYVIDPPALVIAATASRWTWTGSRSLAW